MRRLPRVALSPSAAVALQTVRTFRLFPLSLQTAEAGDTNGGRGSPNLRSSYDMVIVGDGPVSPALACSIGKTSREQHTVLSSKQEISTFLQIFISIPLHSGCEPSLSHKNLLLLQPPSKGEASSKVSILLQSSVDLLKRMISSSAKLLMPIIIVIVHALRVFFIFSILLQKLECGQN